MTRRLFSERHIVIRSRGRIRYLTLSRGSQLAALLVAFGAASAVAGGIFEYVEAGRIVASKEAEVQRAQSSNGDLHAMVAQLQRRLAQAKSEADAAHDENAGLRSQLDTTEQHLDAIDQTQVDLMAQRAEAEGRLKGAQAALDAKTAQIDHMNRGLQSTKSDLKETEQLRAALGAQLHELKSELKDMTNQAVVYRTSWQTAENKLREVATERQKLVAERDGLLARLVTAQAPAPNRAQLGRARAIKVAADGTAASANPRIAVSQLPAPGNPAAAPTTNDTLGYIASETRHGWADVASLLSSAGVDLDKFAARFGAAPRGEGGPFIALHDFKNAAAKPAGAIPERLRRALKTLPLSAPVAHYTLESPFGARVDPLNHRASFHPGVDLAAPFKSPVYSTAPGVVIFAGPKGEYGKCVEIDHGYGITTRYAHLHRIMVVVGQRVGAHHEIGQLGSTGRSTGPHVHYEVHVNGVPQDPEKFLQAGQSIIDVSARH